MRLRVDMSSHSALVVCACGWRALALDRRGALVLATSHERSCHPHDTHARSAWAKYRQRHAAA